MPNIILCRNTERRITRGRRRRGGGEQTAEARLTFHGTSVTKQLIQHINDAMNTVRTVSSTHKNNIGNPNFVWDKTSCHYCAVLVGDLVQRHSDDFMVEILDVIEAMGWECQFEQSAPATKSPITGNEISSDKWIFSKTPCAFQIYKHYEDTETGLGLVNDKRSGMIVVEHIVPGSRFEKTGVPVGAVVMSVNEIPCRGKTVEELMSFIIKEKGDIKVLTY